MWQCWAQLSQWQISSPQSRSGDIAPVSQSGVLPWCPHSTLSELWHAQLSHWHQLLTRLIHAMKIYNFDMCHESLHLFKTCAPVSLNHVDLQPELGISWPARDWPSMTMIRVTLLTMAAQVNECFRIMISISVQTYISIPERLPPVFSPGRILFVDVMKLNWSQSQFNLWSNL